MDWATGINIQNGRFTGGLLQADGSVVSAPLTDLTTKGVPTPSLKTKHVGEVAFSSWIPSSAAEYLTAFGYHGFEKDGSNHEIFEATVAGKRVVVPALVFMRALFRPARYLLPEMFKAQVLDKFCFVDHTTQPARLNIDAFWFQDGYMQGYGEIEKPLSWMCFFPSANLMAASVHERALAGQISFAMPEGTAQVSFLGQAVGGVLFVTEMTIFSVHTDETPFEMATNHPQDILFREGAAARAQKLVEIGTAEQIDVPCHIDGSVELTDTEWAMVGPILLKGERAKGQQLSQRHIFEGILSKFASGVGWRDQQYRAGNWNNARFAHRTWLARGTFNPALKTLQELRAP